MQSPLTGRQIKIGGRAYKKLLEQGHLVSCKTEMPDGICPELPPPPEQSPALSESIIKNDEDESSSSSEESSDESEVKEEGTQQQQEEKEKETQQQEEKKDTSDVDDPDYDHFLSSGYLKYKKQHGRSEAPIADLDNMSVYDIMLIIETLSDIASAKMDKQ